MEEKEGYFKLVIVILVIKNFHVKQNYATWHLNYVDTSNNNNHLSSHEKNIIKKIKK